MDPVTHLRCMICGETYAPDDVDYVCPAHGREGILDVGLDYGLIARTISPDSLAADRETSIWRYRSLLPLATAAPLPALGVGGTPLIAAPRLAQVVGINQVWVKDDGRNPTGSLKDRASAIAVVKAAERDRRTVTTASTGNAAAALAGMCAISGQRCVIFVPAAAPEAKIAQLLVFGAEVVLVDGSYDDAFELCLEATAVYGWYNRNTGYNPYMTEGKKTVSYEIAEQLAWQVPDVVVVSVGDGCIIGGVHKGFKDLVALGWIDRMPRLIGVQAAGSNYLAQAWATGEDLLMKPRIKPQTVADSISAGLPRDRLKAMAAVQETGGAFVTVTDEAILAAIPAQARGSGVFGEPAGAAAYAGLIQAVADGWIGAADRAVIINTGNGLKDSRAAIEATGARPLPIPPTLTAVRARFG